MTRPPVTVFAHAHYPDIWAEMVPLLAERLTLPFRLIVTTSADASEIARPETPNLLSYEVISVENRGRDILPFLRALSVTQGFDVGLKIHTKRSPQREDGRQWREDLLASLLPTPPRVEALVDAIRSDPRIGFVAPSRFALSVAPWILENGAGVNRILSTLGRSLANHDMSGSYFAAGSMFWFRRDALAPLAEAPVLELFEPEGGQLDGTIAHAMERVFPLAARLRGYVSVSVAALEEAGPEVPDAELHALAARHADIPTTYFPAPYVPALPHSPTPQPAAVSGPLRGALRRFIPAALRRPVVTLLARLGLLGR